MRKETGIIMSGDHPRLILKKLKTMTRRTAGLNEINENPGAWEHFGYDESGRFSFRWIGGDRILNIRCPYGQVGDRLWVRETHCFIQGDGNPNDFGVIYKVGKTIWWRDNADKMIYPIENKWRPSIFMPKWAARIWLEITGLRAERVQEISEEDAIREGMTAYYGQDTAWGHFSIVWDSLNAKRGYGWGPNPWVWPISFKVVK